MKHENCQRKIFKCYKGQKTEKSDKVRAKQPNKDARNTDMILQFY